MGHLVLDNGRETQKAPPKQGWCCVRVLPGFDQEPHILPCFPDGGSCMAFSSAVELQAPRQVIRVLDEPKGHNLNEVR